MTEQDSGAQRDAPGIDIQAGPPPAPDAPRREDGIPDADPAADAGGSDAMIQVLRSSEAAAIIGAGGGQVVVPGARLQVPAGALSANVSISLEQTSYYDQDPANAVHMIELGPAGQTFAAPVVLTIDVGGDGGDVLATWSSGASATPFVLPVTNGTVALTSAHFSRVTWLRLARGGICGATRLLGALKELDASWYTIHGLCSCHDNDLGTPGAACCPHSTNACYQSPATYSCERDYCQPTSCGTEGQSPCFSDAEPAYCKTTNLMVEGGKCVPCGQFEGPCCPGRRCAGQLQPSGGAVCTCRCPAPECQLGASRCWRSSEMPSLTGIERCIQGQACGPIWNKDVLSDLCPVDQMCVESSGRASCGPCGQEGQQCCVGGAPCDSSTLICEASKCRRVVTDCNGDPDGTAHVDECGVCVGGLTGKTPCQYTMELLRGYTPDYSGFTVARTINNGDALTMYNGTYEHFRLTLAGRPVKVGPFALAAERVTASRPVSASDVTVGPYSITIRDAENGRSVTRRVNLTVSNAGFRAVAGATITCGLVRLSYRSDFTIERSYTDGTPAGSSTWSLSTTGVEQWVNCQGGPITYRTMGAVNSPFGGTCGTYAMILEGGGFKSNSSAGCPESEQLK